MRSSYLTLNYKITDSGVGTMQSKNNINNWGLIGVGVGTLGHTKHDTDHMP